jgi:hypothetical protein
MVGDLRAKNALKLTSGEPKPTKQDATDKSDCAEWRELCFVL